jgi:threonine/homoserine/homoserine lactone efflux protein
VLLPVLLFVLVATVSPGGATTLATASGVQFGVRRSLPLLLGIAAGLTTLAVAASLGLAGVLLEVPHLELAVRVLGSVYLLWLAWTIGRGGAPGETTLAAPRRFRTGVLLLWLNPKAWAITLSAAGAFATSVDGPARLAALLGGAFLVCSGVSQLLWCALGGAVARLLTEPWHWRALNVALAALVVASVVPIWLGTP